MLLKDHAKFDFLADMTEELYLWHSIGVDEDVHGWIVLSTEDLTGSTDCRDFQHHC
jgi:hypothetical protein